MIQPVDILNFVFIGVILFVSITLHEYSHGFVATKFGDPTPKASGRLTLNPLAHIDIFGTLILPILLLVLSSGKFAFGYAKPVPINPYHFKNPKKDILWVGLAGPAINFIIALLLTGLLKATNYLFIPEIIIEGILINLILGIFNLIPIPPLDGSRVLSAILPYKLSYLYLKMETIGSFIIILLIMIGFLKWFMLPIVGSIFSLLNIKAAI
ncbi:MAG: site-2 protease family protein [Candidatus Omnitrophica bacterium]|jgi:Zn-dependent protease|nr:site-2 protease family protein [Candidatus Omnitrophota bacterium]